MRTHWLLGLALMVICAVQLVSVSATSAHGGWLGSQALGPVSYFDADSNHVLAGNARGDEAVVWQSPRGLVLARASPGRPFGPAELISREQAEAFVAIDDRGDVLVAWAYSDNSVVVPDVGVSGTVAICCERIRVAMVRAGARHVSSASLTPGSVSAEIEAIAVSGDGSLASVVYRSTPKSLIKALGSIENPGGTRGSELFTRVAAFGESFGPAVDLGHEQVLVSLRATARQVIALDTRNSEGEAAPIYEAIISSTGPLRSRQVGDAALRSAEHPELDRYGDLALLVAEENLNPFVISHDLIVQPVGKQLRVVPVAVERGHESEQGLVLEPEGIFDEATLSVSPGGSFLMAWLVYSSAGGSLKVATGRLPHAHLNSPATVPLLSPASVSNPRVAADSDGQAVILVVRSPDVEANAQVVGLFRTSSGRFTGATVLDEVGNTNSLGNAAVTIDEHGEGTALWEADPNYKSELVAERFRVP